MYELSKFEEWIDSIGSKRSWSDVEPADWKIALARIVGIGTSIVGVLALLAA